jgi:L-malate glycosyltransferase
MTTAILEPNFTTTLGNVRQYLREKCAAARPITVCHPVWTLESGGLERQLLQVVEGMSEAPFRHLIIVRGPGELPADLPDHVECLRHDGPQRDLMWSRRLGSILFDEHVDILHVRGLAMLTDGILAAQFAGRVRTIMSFHGFETSPTRIGPIKRRVLRWAIGRCDERWAVSRGAAMGLARELNMEPGDFEVLPNGVDTRRFIPPRDRNAVRKRLGLPLDRRIILNVGNLKPIKGHDILLEAMGRMNGGAKNTTLAIVGQDYRNGVLQKWAAARLPHCDIRFVGRQDDVLPWYQAADVFVLPSQGEGLSNALLEAMACGLPIIATEVGGNSDVVQHGRTGLLIQPDCPQQLADVMTALLADDARRAAWGEAARRYVEQNYNLTQTRGAYEQRYATLAGRRDER